MFRAIKSILKMNREISSGEYVKDEEGRTVLALTVRDDRDFVSPYSYEGDPILSEEASAFLEKRLPPKSYKDNLHIKIFSEVIDDGEKPVYESAIRSSFKEKYKAARHKLHRNLFVSLIMFLAGVVALSLMVLLDFYGLGGVIWLEIVDIVAWVFLWEAADIFFLEQTVTRWEQKKDIAFYKAKISFCSMQKVPILKSQE